MSERIRAIHGDSREVLKTLAECSVDSCVTDPPYALVSIIRRFGADNAAPINNRDEKNGRNGPYHRASSGFMGQKWDTGETAFDPEFWREVLRVLKPGSHLVAFSGTRTYHRMVCAIEDAGFEIRDTIAWLFGSGFPKSHNAGNGWGTALKPAFEPIVLARKPLIGTVAANVAEHGTGAINVDGCRVEHDEDCKPMAAQGVVNSMIQQSGRYEATTELKPGGRWPANVVHDGSEEVVGAFPECEGASSNGRKGVEGVFKNGLGAAPQVPGFDDSGSAARFFYTAKADGDDRLGSKHPTVKPVDLMQWLVRLVTPKTVLSCPQCQPWGDNDSAKKAGSAASVCGVWGDVSPTGQSARGAILQPDVCLEGSGVEASSVQVVRNGVSASEGRGETVLQQAVLMSAHGAQPGEPQAVLNQQEGLQTHLDATSPAREAAGRLPVRASLDNGASDRASVVAGRGGPSQKQRKNGQSSGKSGADAKGRPRQAEPATTEHAPMPALSRQDRNEPTCAHCGHRLERRPGLVLDCFAGTGTTGEAASREGMRALLIEREASYFADIQRRIGLLTAGPDERAWASIKASGKVEGPGPLFEGQPA